MNSNLNLEIKPQLKHFQALALKNDIKILTIALKLKYVEWNKHTHVSFYIIS